MGPPFPAPDDAQVAAIRAVLPPVAPELSGAVYGPDIIPSVLQATGMPRPKYLGAPVPSTALVESGLLDVVSSDYEAWYEAITGLGCALCGEPLSTGLELYFAAAQDPESVDHVLARGALHRRCFKQTTHWCVHIRDRILCGELLPGSLPCDQTKNPALFEILDDQRYSHLREAGVIGEYRILRSAVSYRWPYRPATEPILG